MYTIIGGDGAEYGPVSAAQVRAWIEAKRANLDTRAKVAGSDTWQRLGDFPEFTQAQAEPPPLAADSPLPDGSASDIAEAILSRRGTVNLGDAFERGWEMLRSAFWPCVGISALVLILEIGFRLASDRWVITPGINAFLKTDESKVAAFSLTFLISGAIGTAFQMAFSGIQLYFLRRIRGETPTLQTAFSGFGKPLVPLLIMGPLIFIAIIAGFTALIVPGIYLAVAYSFAPLLVLDKGLSPWTAMEVSRKVVSAHWFTLLGILIIGAMLTLAGIVALGVGLFVATPIVMGAVVSAYESTVNPQQARQR